MTDRPAPLSDSPPDHADPAADVVLDARDLRCPLPVLRAHKALRSMDPGQVLDLWANDPASLEDVRRFCAQGTADLLAQRGEAGGLYRHWLRRRPD
ncbi:sulfurtransferase TusA family protein [Rhodospira trueperi]|nr:sulfurtransferase TusA family protein [Rhodospira trueperi]